MGQACPSRSPTPYPDEELPKDVGGEKDPPATAPGPDVWRTAPGVALSTAAAVAALGAALAVPSKPAVVLTLVCSGAQWIALWVPQECDTANITSRVFAAATLTASAVALFPSAPPGPPAALLALCGASCLGNFVRVAVAEPRQAAGLLQLAVVVPAAVAVRLVYGRVLFNWHPVMMVVGVASIAIGTSVQLGRRNHWLHASLTASGGLELTAGLIVVVTVNVLGKYPHLETLHDWAGVVAYAGVLIQTALAIPTMWPGLSPGERSLVDVHRTLGKANLVLLSAALVTGFAHQYTWTSTPTVLCLLMCAATTLLLITPLPKSFPALTDVSL